MGKRDFLLWLCDRIVHVYGESANCDFVMKLRNFANDDSHECKREELAEVRDEVTRTAAVVQALATLATLRTGDDMSIVDGRYLVAEVNKLVALRARQSDLEKGEEKP